MRYVMFIAATMAAIAMADQNVVNDLNINGHWLKRVVGFTDTNNQVIVFTQSSQSSNMLVAATNLAVRDAAARDVIVTNATIVDAQARINSATGAVNSVMGTKITGLAASNTFVMLSGYSYMFGPLTVTNGLTTSNVQIFDATHGPHPGVTFHVPLGYMDAYLMYKTNQAFKMGENHFGTFGAYREDSGDFIPRRFEVGDPVSNTEAATKSYVDNANTINNPGTNMVWVSLTSQNPVKNGTIGAPFGTIYDAVTNCPNGGTVMVMPGTYWEKYVGTISKSLSIVGMGGCDMTFVYGSGGDKFATVRSGRLLLNGLTLTFTNSSTMFGGAIYVDAVYLSTLSIKDCAFVNCAVSPSGSGGAIYSGGAVGSCELRDSKFTGCFIPTGPAWGGAVVLDNGTINGCTFQNCSAATTGGAIYDDSAVSGTVMVRNCSFDSCSSANGGAIANDGGALLHEIFMCYFRNCTASANGGSVYGVLSIYGCTSVVSQCSINCYDSSAVGGVYGAYVLGCSSNKTGFITSHLY